MPSKNTILHQDLQEVTPNKVDSVIIMSVESFIEDTAKVCWNCLNRESDTDMYGSMT